MSEGDPALRHQLAQLALQLYTPPAPRICWVPRCDACGVVDRVSRSSGHPYAVGIILTYVPGAGWLCDACLAVQAPPGAAMAPAPLSP